MRIRVSNDRLPGFTSERTATSRADLHRETVYDATGQEVGAVVYVGRKVPIGTQYGWRPDSQPGAALTTKVDAIKKMVRITEVEHG